MNNNIIQDGLIKLQLSCNIKIFKKNSQNKLILRDSFKIINDCNRMKKKKVLELSNELKNISNDSINTDTIKKSFQNIITLISNIDNIIIQIDKMNDSTIMSDNNDFIEVYMN